MYSNSDHATGVIRLAAEKAEWGKPLPEGIGTYTGKQEHRYAGKHAVKPCLPVYLFTYTYLLWGE